MDMPLVERRIGRQAIQIFPAIHIVDPYAFTACNDYIQWKIIMGTVQFFDVYIFLRVHGSTFPQI
jgi:hypothetical protein